jgi:hypothetical protein
VKGDRGLIAVRSDIPLAHTVGAQGIITIPDLPALPMSLHARGIYTIARIVTFKDDPLATTRPDVALNLANGKMFRDRENLAWTDPTLKEVRDDNIAVAVEAARAGFDEIQFDYLRFPDAPRAIAFAKTTTEASRLDAITALLAEARLAMQPYNVYLAADIFGYVCWNQNDTGIGQSKSSEGLSIRPARPMIRMAGGDRLCPEQLLGQHRTRQQMRPGQVAKRQHVVRTRDDRRIQSLRAANHEAQRASRSEPPLQQAGQPRAVRRVAALIQRDGERCLRNGAQQ